MGPKFTRNCGACLLVMQFCSSSGRRADWKMYLSLFIDCKRSEVIFSFLCHLLNQIALHMILWIFFVLHTIYVIMSIEVAGLWMLSTAFPLPGIMSFPIPNHNWLQVHLSCVGQMTMGSVM